MAMVHLLSPLVFYSGGQSPACRCDYLSCRGNMGEASDQLYFAMEFVRGNDAHRLLKTHGPLPIRRAVQLVCQLLEALEYAHAKGFVHRDIKPANILVTEVSGRELVK